MKEKKKGKVVWFSAKKGYGFIKDLEDEVDYFVHFSGINVDGFKTLNPDQLVEFIIEENNKGPIAVDVDIIEDSKQE